MNEIGNIKAVNLIPSNRGNNLPQKLNDGKKLPIDAAINRASTAANAATENQKTAPTQDNRQQKLHDAVDSMNDFVQNVKRDLQFTVDKDLNQTVIKVVDSNSGKLIRQIPDDVFLELARKVKETGEMNLLHATG